MQNPPASLLFICLSAPLRSYRGLPDDGDVAVADQPPAGVIQPRLETQLLQNEDPDAQNCQHTDDGEGHEQSKQGDVCYA